MLLEYKNWKVKNDYPEWMNIYALKTLERGYLLEGESPKDAYKRVAKAVANKLNKPHLESKFFEYIWKGWLCLASPVLSNTGTKRGLNISCYSIDIDDSISAIGGGVPELMKLTQAGGGVGIGINRIRPRGTLISKGGESSGVVPYCKIFDSAILATSQGGVRKGAASVNLDVNHNDIYDFLKIRRPHGDSNTQCLNLHHCVVIDDKFMEGVNNGDEEKRDLWLKILKTRIETGEPYIMFKDNVNNNNPEAYKNNNLEVSLTNICSEITLYTDADHSFVCCLSSLNLAKYDEWKDTDLVQTSIWFLDGVLQEFIDKVKEKMSVSSNEALEVKQMMDSMDINSDNYGDQIRDLTIKLTDFVRENQYFKKVLKSAEKGRAVGLGALGWHTFLQSKDIPFASLQARMYTNKIFSQMKNQAEEASKELAIEYGEPEWCKGTGMRNTHLLAVAPTISNATIMGVSHGIEPYIANAYNQKSAKGTFLRKNPNLERKLENKYPQYNTDEIWEEIKTNGGSVQLFDWMDAEDKEVFLTFAEINQLGLVEIASERQKYICQSQSLNLCFAPNEDSRWLHKVHNSAWENGIKTLYYMRSRSLLTGDVATRTTSDCLSCDG